MRYELFSKHYCKEWMLVCTCFTQQVFTSVLRRISLLLSTVNILILIPFSNLLVSVSATIFTNPYNIRTYKQHTDKLQDLI